MGRAPPGRIRGPFCQLTNSATIWVQIQHLESVHPNIYNIYEQMEHVKVLQNQSCRITMILAGDPGWVNSGPVFIVLQKPGILESYQQLVATRCRLR